MPTSKEMDKELGVHDITILTNKSRTHLYNKKKKKKTLFFADKT